MKRLRLIIGGLATSAMMASATPALAEDRFSLKLASAVPRTLPIVGTGAVEALRNIEAVTAGTVRIRYNDPGALVPALEVFDAVSRGSIDAGWHSGSMIKGKIPAMSFFTALPFGPAASEYVGWYYYGGGREIHNRVYAEHNIKPIVCLMLAPEGSGWFNRELATPQDIAGLKMRISGFGGEVLDRLGASSQLLPAGDVFAALERGVIDGAEVSMPVIDEQLGLYKVAQFYYLPGWHQQSTMWELLINLDTWNQMSETQQAQIQASCTANVTLSMAQSEAAQIEALQSLEAEGADIRMWPEENLETLRTAWDETAAEYAANDPLFSELLNSYTTFREGYALWREAGYLRN